MTTDDLAQRLPASRLFKGTTTFLLAMAVALASTASPAKTPNKPTTAKTAAKAPAAGKKSTQAKAKPATAASRKNKVEGIVGMPVKETLAASPAHAIAPSPEEAIDGLPAKAGTPVTTTSADAMAPAAGKPVAAKGGIRELASDAAASTLTLLLPRIAAGDDALPLLGRSTEVASDLGRLLAAGQGTPASPPPSDKVQSVLKRALTLLGTPYRWGGTSPESGFDCSGLVGYVFRTALGVELPRVSRDMARDNGARLVKNRDELREGDLVFFGRRKGRIDHVGIYLGNGQFVHAPRTGKDVEVSSLASGYWSGKFMQARRVEL